MTSTSLAEYADLRTQLLDSFAVVNSLIEEALSEVDEGEAQTLTSGAERNLLKLGELRGTLTEEEAALCTYICPSKIQFDMLLLEGLAMYEREA